MATYLTSDLHFNHRNIQKTLRPAFASTAEHDEYVIRKYNEIVGEDDKVYILGDLGFSPVAALDPLVRRLNGRKTLIIGNHDQLNDAKYHAMGIDEVVRHPLYLTDSIVLSHAPLKEALDNPFILNVHGHLHGAVLDFPNFVNVNVDVRGYEPVDLELIKAKAAEMCRPYRWEPYGLEWYAAHEIKTGAEK